MKKGLTLLEVIVGIVTVSTSIIVLLAMMMVYNKSYEITEKYYSDLTELLRTKKIIDQIMERNRNKTFKYIDNMLYVEDELVLIINENEIVDCQTNVDISLDKKEIFLSILNNNLLCFTVKVGEIHQDYMYFIGGFVIDS